MKKFAVILFCLCAAAGLHAQSTGNVQAGDLTISNQPKEVLAAHSSATDEVWNQANTAYINASYDQAIRLYDSIRTLGGTSYKLYYNLANAYFKSGEIGRSILYYNKAQRLAPSDGDIRHNLAVANTYTKDKIEQVPEFFIERWVRALRMSLSSNTWAIVSLLLLIAACGALLLYLLSGRLGRRKAGFHVALACCVLLAVAVIFSLAGRREMLSPDQGIVMSTAVPVKSSPDRGGKDLFVIHEGTKVKVVGSLQQWYEVALADGKKGWIEASTIEMI